MIPLLFAILALIGAPLFAIIAAGTLNAYYADQTDLSVVIIDFFRLSDNPVLISLPLFTFAGYLLGETNAPKRLVRLTQATIGWMPGGLAIVTLLVCSFFTAFTGASGVTIIALGSLLYPALLRGGYDEKFSLGMITSSGSLGILFMPAIPLILYGIIAQQSIDKMFAAGVMPGILMILVLSGYALVHSIIQDKKKKIPLQKFDMKVLGAAFKETVWELPLPFIVLGGIYSGYFAISEAAAVTAFYVLIIEVFVYREIKLSRLPVVMRQSMTLVGGILIILGVSIASTTYMIENDVQEKLFGLVKSYIDSPLSFLIALNVFLLILGCVLDIFSAIVLVVPLLLPMAAHYEINPIHLGIIFLANMQIGYCTPPVGMNLFIASYRFKKPIIQIYWATLPYIILLLIVVLIITYVPEFSLFLTEYVG